MSDLGRESLTDKVGAAIKPDSEKSTTEHLGDKLKGHADSAGSSLQPESQKSTTQQMGDSLSTNKNENTGSLLDKAKDAVGLGGATHHTTSTGNTHSV